MQTHVACKLHMQHLCKQRWQYTHLNMRYTLPLESPGALVALGSSSVLLISVFDLKSMLMVGMRTLL